MKKYTLPSIMTAIILMLSFVTIPFCASAAGKDTYSLTVNFYTAGQGFRDVKFRAYNALTSSGELTGAFAGYDVNVDMSDSDSLRALAETLAAYAVRDDIPADYEHVTGVGGSAVFSELDAGVYLVVGDKVTLEETIYTPQPFIVYVPYTDKDGDTLNDVTANVKFTSDEVDKSIELSAEKVWNDNGAADRPAEVTVELLKDGEKYDVQKLNEENGWKCDWSGLDPAADWKLAESEVPAGYTVQVSLDDGKFTVTNTKSKPDEPTPPSTTTSEPNTPPPASTTSGPGDPPPPSTTSPDKGEGDVTTDRSETSRTDTSSPKDNNTVTTTTPSGGGTPGSSSTSTLPQTGLLRWPVPILFFAGLVTLLAGIMVKKLNDNENN